MEDYADLKNKLEAVLFTIGRFIDTEELAKICNIGSVGLVNDALLELKKDYEARNSSLEILHEDNKWRLNIKGKYGNTTNRILSDSELDSPTMKTLALIAYKQPVEQSKIIKARGNSAYVHIKLLKEQNFIITEKIGRTRLIKLTKVFYDYFDVNKDELKAKLDNPQLKESLENLP